MNPRPTLLLAIAVSMTAAAHAQTALQVPPDLRTTVPIVQNPAAPAAAASSATRRVASADTPAPPAEGRDRSEPNVKHTVIEDNGSRVDELRVRGQVQHITVTPKVGTTKSYEIITDSGGREMYDGSGASRGAVGKRVWNVFNF